jgi:signal transduction histidine kinase
MRVGLIGRTVIGTAVLAVLVIGLLLALIRAVDDEQDAASAANRSERTISLSALTERTVLDIQSSVRGYLLTGDERLLGPWRGAQTSLPRTVDGLVASTAGEPVQSARSREIHADALSYLREFANPVVAGARGDGVDAGRALRESLQGGRLADDLRGEITQLGRTETADLAAQRADVEHAADRAKTLAVVGIVGFLLLLGLVLVLITRRVAFPVRDLARAADRVREGDLDIDVPVRSRTEVGRLTESFNSMARALQESRDELESQNAELEMQTVELEARQAQLAEAGDELRAQRDELEVTAGLLAEEKRLAELFGDFGERLAAETDVRALAAIALDTLAEVTGADVGALFGARRETAPYWASLAVRGLADGAVSDRVARGGEGAAARAVAEGGPVTVEASGLRVHTLGGESVVRAELHVPLLHGSRAVGVVTLGRLGEEGFGGVDLGVVRRLAGQAAVALAEVGSVAEVRWLVQVNKVVLDSVREGIALFGRNGRVILSNVAMERIAQDTIGTSAGGTIARGPAAIAALTRDPAGCIAAWERVLSDPPEPTFDEFEIAATGKVLEMYSAPVDAPPGRRVGRLLVMRDVTDERQAERLKSDLMSTVSHELRTPLASVLGYAELLRTREMDPAARGRILGVVHREAQRLSALIDDFLDLQRIEEDRLRLERRPFRVDELLDEQVRTFRGQSETHRLELSIEESPLLASGDRRRIAQVIANLLSNAIKYSPDGGLVRVEGVRGNGEVMVAVSDEGLGIPSDQQPQVFEKFFRVPRPEVSEIGGTGLGLALAHEIVAAHEGRIGFESIEGQGSRFWFTLPGV